MSGGEVKEPVIASIRVMDIESGYGFWVDTIDEINHREKWRYVVWNFSDGFNRVVVYAEKRAQLTTEAAKFIAKRHKEHPTQSTFYKGCMAKYAHEIEWSEPRTVFAEELL